MVSDSSAAGRDISRPWARAAVCALTIVAGLLRFYHLGTESVWYDEAASWEQAKDSFLAVFSRTARDNYPPLHNIFLYASIKLFGDGAWALRLPSAVFGTLTIPALYAAGTRLHGRFAGVLAAALLTLSYFHISYSQEGRMYTLLVLSCVCFVDAAIAVVTAYEPRRAVWAALSSVALLYSHPYGTFYWLAIVAAITACFTPWRTLGRPELLRLAGSLGAGPVVFLLWAPTLVDRAERITARGFWIPYPTVSFIESNLVSLVGGPWPAGVIGLALGLAVNVAWRGNSSPAGAPPLGRVLAFLLVWAFLPVAIAVAISLVGRPIFVARYVAPSLPALLLAAGIGFAACVHTASSRVLVLLLLTVIATGNLMRERPYAMHKQDWRGLTSAIVPDLKPRDCLAFTPPYNAAAYRYYDRKPRCVVRLDDPKSLDQASRMARRLIVVVTDGTKVDGGGVVELMKPRGFEPRDKQKFHRLTVLTFSP